MAEHLLALGGDDYDRFMAARIDGPCCSYEEEDIFRYTAYPPDIPEAKAIDRFGRTELGLEEEWSEQLVMDCIFEFGNALVENNSWVRTVLDSEQFGNIKFRTIEQVRTYQDLGNKLYQVMPNPVLKGFRPMDLENAPAIPDAIPDRVQDIPDSRGKLEELCAPFGGREKAAELFLNALSSGSTAPKKIRRKDPCPCGSGKKYKNCHGKNLS